MLKWQIELLRAFENEQSSPIQIADYDLDKVLSWVGNFPFSMDKMALACINSAGGRSLAQIRLLELLDKSILLIPVQHATLYGTHHVSKVNRQTLKKRHSLLVKVFHPDRRMADEKWLTKRMELINNAYTEVLKTPTLITKPVAKTPIYSKQAKRPVNSKDRINEVVEQPKNYFKLSFILLGSKATELRRKLPPNLTRLLIIFMLILISIYILVIFAGIYFENG